MKTKFILTASALVLLLSLNSFGQVVLTPKKITYQRADVNLPDYKKTFEIIYPEVSGIADSDIKMTLEDTLSYWKNFDQSLEENLNESPSIDSADFIVNYHQNSILDITLTMAVSGAYPTDLAKNLVVDLNTGKRLMIPHVFSDVPGLIIKIEKSKKAEEKRTLAEIGKQSRADKSTLLEMLKQKKYSINTLDEFSVNDEGVTFTYNYEFPHVIQALAPDGTYFYSWAEIKPFIKLDGVLGRFAR